MVPHDILSATKLAVHPFATTGIATNSVPFYFNIIHTFQSQYMSNIPSHRTRNLDGLMDRWSMMRNGEMLEGDRRGGVSPRSAPRGKGISRCYERKWERYRAEDSRENIKEQERFRVLATHLRQFLRVTRRRS